MCENYEYYMKHWTITGTKTEKLLKRSYCLNSFEDLTTACQHETGDGVYDKNKDL